MTKYHRIREVEARRRPNLAEGQAFALDLRAKAATEIGGSKGGLKPERMEEDALNQISEKESVRNTVDNAVCKKICQCNRRMEQQKLAIIKDERNRNIPDYNIYVTPRYKDLGLSIYNIQYQRYFIDH